MKILKWFLKLICILVISVLAIVLLAWGGLHVAKFVLYPDYYAQGEQVSKIPALNDGFVPQGLDYDPETDTYIHSGYNGKKAELYLVTDKETKAIVLLTPEGEQAKGHAGGVTRAGNYLYISDNHAEGDGKVGYLRIYRFSDIWNAKDGDSVKAIGQFTVAIICRYRYRNCTGCSCCICRSPWVMIYRSRSSTNVKFIYSKCQSSCLKILGQILRYNTTCRFCIQN